MDPVGGVQSAKWTARVSELGCSPAGARCVQTMSLELALVSPAFPEPGLGEEGIFTSLNPTCQLY